VFTRVSSAWASSSIRPALRRPGDVCAWRRDVLQWPPAPLNRGFERGSTGWRRHRGTRRTDRGCGRRGRRPQRGSHARLAWRWSPRCPAETAGPDRHRLVRDGETSNEMKPPGLRSPRRSGESAGHRYFRPNRGADPSREW